MKFIQVIFTLFLLSNYCNAQNFDSSIVLNEKKLSNCLEKENFDSAMKRCYLRSSIELDSILNIVYKKTMPLLKPNDQIAFRENQRKWLLFYNSEKSFNTKIFWSQNSDEKYQFGTLVDLSISANNYKMLKNRVEILSVYYTILTTGL